jgi:hypothetical protein
MTAGSFSIPASPAYFAARPGPSGDAPDSSGPLAGSPATAAARAMAVTAAIMMNLVPDLVMSSVLKRRVSMIRSSQLQAGW